MIDQIGDMSIVTKKLSKNIFGKFPLEHFWKISLSKQSKNHIENISISKQSKNI